MKTIFLVLLLLIFSACASEPVEEPVVEVSPQPVAQEEVVEEDLELINEIQFNSNLVDFEQEWLYYLDEKYPESKIYHIKTEEINCEDCYEVSYKKDRTVIKIKVLNGEKNSEKTSTDLIVDIENEQVCSLFQGSWNECPKLCYTDEEACENQCGLPVCEFDENKLTFKELGEICGGLDEGDCAFDLVCKYTDKNDDYGICVEK